MLCCVVSVCMCETTYRLSDDAKESRLVECGAQRVTARQQHEDVPGEAAEVVDVEEA